MYMPHWHQSTHGSTCYIHHIYIYERENVRAASIEINFNHTSPITCARVRRQIQHLQTEYTHAHSCIYILIEMNSCMRGHLHYHTTTIIYSN